MAMCHFAVTAKYEAGVFNRKEHHRRRTAIDF